jgi:hypothetical protein
MSPLPFMSEGCGTVLTIGSRRESGIGSPTFHFLPRLTGEDKGGGKMQG